MPWHRCSRCCWSGSSRSCRHHLCNMNLQWSRQRIGEAIASAPVQVLQVLQVTLVQASCARWIFAAFTLCYLQRTSLFFTWSCADPLNMTGHLMSFAKRWNQLFAQGALSITAHSLLGCAVGNGFFLGFGWLDVVTEGYLAWDTVNPHICQRNPIELTSFLNTADHRIPYCVIIGTDGFGQLFDETAPSALVFLNLFSVFFSHHCTSKVSSRRSVRNNDEVVI